MLVRGTALTLGLALLVAGLAGLVLQRSGLERTDERVAQAADAVSRMGTAAGLVEKDAAKLAERATELVGALEERVVHCGLFLLGLVLLRVGLVGRRGTTRPSGRGPRPIDGAELEVKRSPREIRRLVKEARVREAESGAEAAGDFLFGEGLLEEAVEMFTRAGALARAAQVRHDQNRFEEAARLLAEAGKPEGAGAIYAQLERFEEAARCYLDAGKCSVAGEMFERSGNHHEAGRCYRAIGFHRNAADAYLRAGRELEAAQCLIAAFDEEGGGAALEENKAKELRALACKAGELLVKLGRMEDAESILLRAGALARAAQVAFQVGAYDRASELFLRIGRGDLAAKALEKARDSVGAARVLGEFLRDKGRDEEAVVHLEKAGDHVDAADLYRKLERFEEAAGCYAKAGEFTSAAEMYQAAQKLEKAALAYEKAGCFEDAAACFGQIDEPRRQAAMLEQAEEFLEAGKVYADAAEADAAIRVLQRVEAVDVDFSECCALLGRLFLEKGMTSLSIKKFEASTGSESVSRSNVQTYYALAQAQEEQGSASAAAQIYEQIVSFDYEYGEAAARLERIKEAADQVQSTSASTKREGPPSETRYELIRELGRGGMGVVYLARDRVLEREVAYKVLPESLRENRNALRNFLREAKASAQLNHPSIVTVYDAGDSEHGFYLAMEYVDGTTLKEILRRRGPIAPAGVIYILRQMADALSYAHSKRVVHRDVKTANTMWTRDKQVKIMDFGLAKVMEEVRNATTLVAGTPFYMSPEQTLGRNVDHRTDIYSLGVTVFELATGELPFREGNVPYHHVHTPPPDPRTLRPDLPEPLVQVILRCLEKDPAARFQEAREIREAFQVREGGGTPSGDAGA